MTKLHDILTDMGAALFCKGQDWKPGDGSASEVDPICDEAEQQIKALFTELIGEDERTEDHEIIKAWGGKWRNEIAADNLKRQRNKWRAGLRQKVNDL